MNKRLKELVEQAKIQLTKPTNYATAVAADGQQKALEKFAELIVRECIIICKDIDGEDNIDARSGRHDCAVEIQEHFGVIE